MDDHLFPAIANNKTLQGKRLHLFLKLLESIESSYKFKVDFISLSIYIKECM